MVGRCNNTAYYNNYKGFNEKMNIEDQSPTMSCRIIYDYNNIDEVALLDQYFYLRIIQ
jgi:hypothetical protein